MRHETAIDTVELKSNFNDKDECDATVGVLISTLEKYDYYIKFEDEYKIQIEYKHKLIASIRKGSFSFVNQDKEKEDTTWYISIKLAGIKRYIHYIDCAASNCLIF